MEAKLEELIRDFPHRWEKAQRDANSADWFIDQLVESNFTIDGNLRPTTLPEEEIARKEAQFHVSKALKREAGVK